MKISHYLFAFIISFNSFISIAQSGIAFKDISLEEAKTLAAKENKLIFIDAYADWCGPCKWMVANTFTDSEVGDFFKNNVISLQIDMESEIGMEFDLEYFVDAYPTLLFLNAEGEVVKRHTGAMDAGEFLRFGKLAIDPSSSMVLQLKKRIDEGEQNE